MFFQWFQPVQQFMKLDYHKNMAQKFTVTVFTENKPGLLYRIAGLFLRRKINVESLTVSEIEHHGISRFTIVVKEEKGVVDKVVHQLYRIVEVVYVTDCTDEELITKEMAFIKVIVNEKEKQSIEWIVKKQNAEIIYDDNEFIVIQVIGSETDVNQLHQLLEGYRIKEFVRTGRIAVFKDREFDGYDFFGLQK